MFQQDAERALPSGPVCAVGSCRTRLAAKGACAAWVRRADQRAKYASVVAARRVWGTARLPALARTRKKVAALQAWLCKLKGTRAHGAGATLMRLCAMLISATQAVHNCVLTAWRTSATVGWKIFLGCWDGRVKDQAWFATIAPKATSIIIVFYLKRFLIPPFKGEGDGGC